MSEPPNPSQQTQPPPLPAPQQPATNYNPYYAQYYNYYNPYYQYPQPHPHPPPPPAPTTSINNQPQPQPQPPPPPPPMHPYYYNHPQAHPPPPPPPNQNVSFGWNHANMPKPPPPPPPPINSVFTNNTTKSKSNLYSHFVPSTTTPSTRQVQWKNNTMVSSSSSPSSNSWNHNNKIPNNNMIRLNGKKRTHSKVYPAALTNYFQKCLSRFKELSSHLETSLNKDILQQQLRSRIAKCKAANTLFQIDWVNEPYPQHLLHLISIDPKSSSSLSPNRKRKAETQLQTANVIRKVAKISASHREIIKMDKMDKNTRSFLESSPDSPPPSFVSTSNNNNKCNKNNNGKQSNNNINFSIKNSSKKHNNNNMNPFGYTSDSDNDTNMIIISSKKHQKKHKKTFKWNSNDGIDALNDESSESKEIDKILERRARFDLPNDNNRNFITKTSKIFNNNNNNDISDWNYNNRRVIGTCTKVEKDFYRLTSEPDPSEVRTLDTLKKAFDFLQIRWKVKKDYLYVGGQFKSLRQDLRVQHIRNLFSVSVYESNARICLSVSDLSEYNQCQGQLRELYSISSSFCTNLIEFLSYRLLYEAVTKNYSGVSSIIRQYRQYCCNIEIRNVIRIINSIQNNNYLIFFKIYKLLRIHCQYILNQIIYKIRFNALSCILISYSPSTYPINNLTKILLIKNNKECIKYCKNCGCILQNNNKQINCKKSRGKIKEWIPKSEDDKLGVTHGSVYHRKNQNEYTITKFLRKS